MTSWKDLAHTGELLLGFDYLNTESRIMSAKAHQWVGPHWVNNTEVIIWNEWHIIDELYKENEFYELYRKGNNYMMFHWNDKILTYMRWSEETETIRDKYGDLVSLKE